MDALEEATAALSFAEQQLRSILVKAAEVGQYDHLPRIAEWAKLLNTMLAGQLKFTPALAAPPAVSPELVESLCYEQSEDRKTRLNAFRHVPVVSRKTKAVRTKKKRRSRAANVDYPKFLREGDSLVKVGWSKREKKPYEHKAPRSVLMALVQALLRVGSEGKRFTVEEVLPLKDGTAGTEIPDYQTYLTLAWLRSNELITQHGRQGYSLPKDREVDSDSDKLWNELETR